MKTVRYVVSLGTIAVLLFIGSSFAYGPEATGLAMDTEAPIVMAEPTKVLLFGIALTIIGSFGSRKFIKKSS